MAIHQTTREEFGQEVTLYRWECLQHPTKKGVWTQKIEAARKGMRVHVETHHSAPVDRDIARLERKYRV